MEMLRSLRGDKHESTAVCHLVRLSSTTNLGSVCLYRWAFRRLDLVDAFGLVHRRVIWLMPADLVGNAECDRPLRRRQWPYSLPSCRSSWLVRQFLFRLPQQSIRRNLQHNVPPSLFFWRPSRTAAHPNVFSGLVLLVS